MDLQDFKGQLMYFDEPVPENVEELMTKASEAYAQGRAEWYLQQAYSLAPENMTVLVGLYRYYYYQHRLQDAIDIAFQVMARLAPDIGFPKHWEMLRFEHLAWGVMQSFTRVRMYLLALKGAAYMNLRLGNINQGVRMLNRVVELDSNDRLGAKALLRSMGPLVVADDGKTERAVC